MIKQVQVVYGYMMEKLSRKQAERFILAHNFASPDPLPIPSPPVSRFWCRPAPDGSPAPWMIGWSGPVAVREEQVKAINDERLIPFTTHEESARGAIVH